MVNDVGEISNSVGGLHELRFAHSTLNTEVVMLLVTPNNNAYAYIYGRWYFNTIFDVYDRQGYGLTFDDLRPNEQMLVYEWLMS